MYDHQFSDPVFTALIQLRQTWSAVYRAMERELAKVGLTPIKTFVLWLCKDYRGTLSPVEISRLLFRESQTIAGLLARMERDGLVRRAPRRKGQPFTQVQITAKGEELLRPGKRVIMALGANILSSLSAEELEQFQELLRKVQQRALEQLGVELRPWPPALARRSTDIER